MAKVKTYWDEIKNEESYYYGGKQGFEVPLKWVETRRYDSKTRTTKRGKSLQFQWPFGCGDGVPASEKALVRKEVTAARKKEKMLAQASRNQEEFRDLYNRISRISEDEWNEIVATGLKGFDLGNYIRQSRYTEREANALFYNM